MTLYRSGHRPHRLPAKYIACGIVINGDGQAADRMRQFGVPDSYGNPTDAVAFFDDDGDGSLGAMVADYPNGRRAEYRVTSHGSRLSITTPQVPA